MPTLDALFDVLLGRSPTVSAIDAFDAWWTLDAPVRARFAGASFERAVAGGFLVDRLGWAFAAGYHAALSRLDPALPPDHRAALCATEVGGGHPRAIECALIAHADGYTLRGHKRYVSLGTHADALLVVASVGRDGDRNRLRVARVAASARGVSFVTMPALAFVPEVPHAELTLDDVAVRADALLPGDGYAAVLKPFRTIEDLHVHGAALGYLIAVARRCGDDALVARLLALAVSARALAVDDPSSAAVHVAVAGVLAGFEAMSDAIAAMWTRAPDSERDRWERDRPLLSIASRVRAARTTAAWTSLRARHDA